MITIFPQITEMINSPVRNLACRVEWYRGSTLKSRFTGEKFFQSFKIERIADNSKFFGMVVCQKINLKFADIDRELDIQTGDTFKVNLGVDVYYNNFAPTFTVTEVHRNENTNQLSVTGYDAIYKLRDYTISDLQLTAPYTINDFVTTFANFMGKRFEVRNVFGTSPFRLNYPTGANFDGTENLRDVLTQVAEATQTVVYLDKDDKLIFTRLTPLDMVIENVSKDKYITLSSKTNRRLVGIASVTTLGDNVEAKLDQSGTVQQIIDNPFLELRDDIDTILDNALEQLGGLTINQFSCSWFGSLILEIGDKISLTTKDNEVVESYILDDTITYDGSLRQSSQWEYTDDGEAFTNPTSIGDLLKQTYARVDKQQKEIDLHASNIQDNNQQISDLKLSTNGIQAIVTEYNRKNDTAFDNINGSLQDIRNSVAAQITESQLRIIVSETIENSVKKVETETGFTFDKDGLNITKTGSNMSTIIDEDGMDIYRGGEKALTVDNTGVNAINLTARQYLLIGTHSRFEDYNYNRTGCFWIG